MSQTESTTTTNLRHYSFIFIKGNEHMLGFRIGSNARYGARASWHCHPNCSLTKRDKRRVLTSPNFAPTRSHLYLRCTPWRPSLTSFDTYRRMRLLRHPHPRQQHRRLHTHPLRHPLKLVLLIYRRCLPLIAEALRRHHHRPTQFHRDTTQLGPFQPVLSFAGNTR